MADLTKKSRRVVLMIDMVNLARIHKFFLRGFEWSIESAEEVRKANEFVGLMEGYLLQSGYMNEQEIRERHRLFVDEKLKQGVASKEELVI